MVGFLGFLVLAVGGGGLALFLGVPPTWIGIYVAGLLVIGAISGFGSSSSSGGSGGGSGGGSSGSRSTFGNAADAATGFLDGLGGSDSSSSSRTRSGGDSNTGEVSLADNPDERRRVGSFGNPTGDEDSVPEEVSGNDSGGTTEEEYLNSDNDNEDMGLLGGDDAEQEDKELHELVKALDKKEEMEKQEIRYDEDLKRKISDVIEELEDYLQHEQRIEEIVGKSGEITVGQIMQHGDEIGQDIRAMNGDLLELKQDLTDVKNEIGEEERVHSNVNQAEEAEEELMDHILQEEKRLEQMQEKLQQIVDGKVQMN